MAKYEVYKAEEKTSAKGNAYKKLVLQEEGAQYPIKNVTMFASHPLFEEIAPGQTVELEVQTEDSETPNPHGGFYKNRTVVNPGQQPKSPAKKEEVRAESDDARVYNVIQFKVLPILQAMHKEIMAISGRQERQMGLDPSAIDDAINGEDSPF